MTLLSATRMSAKCHVWTTSSSTDIAFYKGPALLFGDWWGWSPPITAAWLMTPTGRLSVGRRSFPPTGALQEGTMLRLIPLDVWAAAAIAVVGCVVEIFDPEPRNFHSDLSRSMRFHRRSDYRRRTRLILRPFGRMSLSSRQRGPMSDIEERPFLRWGTFCVPKTRTFDFQKYLANREAL